tara:strand:- start:51 stop:203 length:153 start_codon:yes stop_codon:yes gene_type:complete
MSKSYKSLDELIEDSAKAANKAKEVVARSQEQRQLDESNWKYITRNRHWL